MALKRVIRTDFDVDVIYHLIALTNIDWLNKMAHIEVLSYASEAARRNGKQPLAMIAFDWKAEDFPFLPGDNIQAKSYQKIKTLAAWQGSEDV